MPRIVFPDDWTPEQADAVADFLYSVYLQLMDALYEQYPAAVRPYRLPGERHSGHSDGDAADDVDA
jgi:hypothetical protein